MGSVTTTEPRQIRYVRPKLYPKQEAALFHDDRYGVVEASTKAGKTVGCLIWLHEQAALRGAPGRHFWWVAPIFPQARIAFDRLKRYLPRGSFTSNKAEMSIELANGAAIWFKSGDNPDSLYGEDVYAAVVDEASRVKAESWHALRSTLTATGGPVRIIGNVKGRKNWAYRLGRVAESGRAGYRYAKLTAYDAAEASDLTGVTLEEIADAEAVLPADVFQELFLAEAVGGEELFFDVDKAGVVDRAPPHAKLCRAWDLAATRKDKKNPNPDWTVGFKMGHDGTQFYVVDVVRRRTSPDGVTKLLVETAISDGPDCVQLIEEEKGAAGKVLIDSMKQLLRGTDAGRVEPAPTTGDKEARAFSFASTWNAGRVLLVRGEWVPALLMEYRDFPDDSVFDDQVDAGAHAFNYLAPTAAPRLRWIG